MLKQHIRTEMRAKMRLRRVRLQSFGWCVQGKKCAFVEVNLSNQSLQAKLYILSVHPVFMEHNAKKRVVEVTKSRKTNPSLVFSPIAGYFGPSCAYRCSCFHGATCDKGFALLFVFAYCRNLF